MTSIRLNLKAHWNGHPWEQSPCGATAGASSTFIFNHCWFNCQDNSDRAVRHVATVIAMSVIHPNTIPLRFG